MTEQDTESCNHKNTMRKKEMPYVSRGGYSNGIWYWVTRCCDCGNVVNREKVR